MVGMVAVDGTRDCALSYLLQNQIVLIAMLSKYEK